MRNGEAEGARAAIALGSNLHSHWGSPGDALLEALRRLRRLGEVTAVSSFRETEPVGYTDQPRFVNAAALLHTALRPLEVLRGCLAIEAEMGRVRAADAPPKGPRIVDLDLLLWVDARGVAAVLEGAEPTLPHPALHLRRFVLEPLAEIAPAMEHPVLRASIAQLLHRLPAGD